MNEVLSYLKRLLHPNDTIVVATSGGPDSMCLLHLLCELKSYYHLNLIVAHVNHKLRSESEKEAAFVQDFAFSHHLNYEYMEITEYQLGNLESIARKKRYAFFSEVIQKYHASYLMTAHHGDDLTETILMRLVRGSSLKGYSGFQREIDMKNYQMIRPLITLTKSDIQEYMDKNHYQYFIDQSNYSKKYTRNRYRMEVLPFFKKENSQVHLKFLKFSRELAQANQFIDSYVQKLIPTLKNKEGLSISKLKELDAFLLKRVIEYELGLIYTSDLFLILDKHRDAIINLIYSHESNLCLHLPHSILAIKEYDCLKIISDKENEPYHFVFDTEIKLPTGVLKQVSNSDEVSNFVIRLNSQDIALPIRIRTRENGDYMSVKNLNGTKKVKDILINEKIPISKRACLPIVTDNNNCILWIPGVKKSKFDVERNGIYDIILSYEEEKHE